MRSDHDGGTLVASSPQTTTGPKTTQRFQNFRPRNSNSRTNSTSGSNFQRPSFPHSTPNQFLFDYEAEIKKCAHFLSNFQLDDIDLGKKVNKYMEILKRVALTQQKLIEIHLDDIIAFNASDDLVDKIEANTLRYIEIFSEAVNRTIPDPNEETNTRIHQEEDQTQNEIAPQTIKNKYELVFIPRQSVKDIPFRQVRSSHVGKLISLKAVVVRVTEVKPLLMVVTYTCENCGHEIYQEVTSRTFNPLVTCPSPQCKLNSSPGKLQMQSRGSKFLKYQEAKIQELPEQVPIGHIPRTMNVHLRGELTRQCTPGDIITLDGVFLPTPYSDNYYKAGLLADTYLETMKITQHKKSYGTFEAEAELIEKVKELNTEGNAYTKLASSIAPEIFGSLDVKKALLLLMVGGTTKKLDDGMKIRGDINICLMGDPGVAKSQLLKHIATIAPRGIYTSGKGSSGVGLTAAVLKDPVTGELVLEGGSLVLADKGICCIDEFDKMEDADRTAIHEVMEQQTISVAKAGITTTLNARTSILAAANPAFGRYNIKRSPSENINLPAALLSRFDLLFLLLDKADKENDMALAEHVTYVHQNGKHPVSSTQILSPEFIRAYIAEAKKFHPYVPKHLTEYIVTVYTNMRRDEVQSTEQFTYTTARTLLGILRIATALARIRFSSQVDQSDVDEAIRLMHVSKASLIESRQKTKRVDPMSVIYDIIRNMAQNSQTPQLPNPSIKYQEISQRILAKGFTQQQLDQCLDEYAKLGIWFVAGNKNEVRFIDHNSK